MGQNFDEKFMKNLVINLYRIFSIMKIYIIYVSYFYCLYCLLNVQRSWWNRLIFCMLYEFLKIKSWSKYFSVSLVKNRCGQFDHWSLKLSLYQEWTDVTNYFFACWHKFRNAKCCFNDFWVGMVKNVHKPNLSEILYLIKLLSSIICIIMNLWIELIFCMLIVMQ